MNQERIPILKKPMSKHPIKKPVPIEPAPRHIAVLMRRQNISKHDAEYLVQQIGMLADEGSIGECTNKEIAEFVGWKGPPSDLVDDLVAAEVLRWDDDDELVFVEREE